MMEICSHMHLLCIEYHHKKKKHTIYSSVYGFSFLSKLLQEESVGKKLLEACQDSST